MAAALNMADVEQFREQGFVPARSVLTSGEVRHYRKCLEDFEAAQGATLGELPGQLRAKTHLLFPWMDELARHPAILDVVEGLIGPDILIYHVTSWLKEPGTGSYVSWHQDATYFGLDPAEHVTAWVALSNSNLESGCVRVLPGSHRQGQRPHESGPTEGNLLSNGQVLRGIALDEPGVALEVPPGHLSVHHTHLMHASGPNRTAERRIGFGISYIPTRVRHLGETRLTAMLVRGEDHFDHFEHEVPPAGEFDDAARARHAEACERFFASHGSRRTGDGAGAIEAH